MLVLLPVGILVLTGSAVLVMRQLKTGIGYIWLSTLVGSLATWLTLFIVNWDNVSPLNSQYWNLPGSEGFPIGFALDRFSWPFAFALAGLLVSVLLTATVRFHFQSDPYTWSSSLFIGAAGLLAVMATTPLTLVLTWTVVDIIELAVLFMLGGEKALNQRILLSFIARFGGVLLVLWAIITSRAGESILVFASATPPFSVFLLLAAGLRLGVIPLHLAYTDEPLTRRGLGTMLRLVPPAASLVLLSRLPAAVVPPNSAVFVLLFSILAAGFGAIMWLFAKDDLIGRPYWMIALAGLAIASGVRGQPDSIPAWGVAMILVGGLVFLYSEHRNQYLAIPLVGIIALSGLPFTPAASGLPGLSVFPFNLPDIVFILVHAILLAGTMRQLLRKTEPQAHDRWLVAVYIFGLVLLILCHWLIGLFGMPVPLQAGIWWVALISILIAAVVTLFMWFWQKSGLAIFLSKDPRLELARRVSRILEAVLRLDWFYVLIGLILKALQGLIAFFTRLLEGEGGVLWTLLLILLLASFIVFGGSP